MSKGKTQVSDVDFVQAFVANIGNGVKAVATALNLTESAVYTRAKKMKAQGVNLPSPPTGKRGRAKGQVARTGDDVAALNALIAGVKSTASDTVTE